MQEVAAGHEDQVQGKEGILRDLKKISMSASRYYSYARALRSRSDYGKQMKFLSDTIFGEPRRPMTPGSGRILRMFQRKPYEERKEIVQYYPAHEHVSEDALKRV